MVAGNSHRSTEYFRDSSGSDTGLALVFGRNRLAPTFRTPFDPPEYRVAIHGYNSKVFRPSWKLSGQRVKWLERTPGCTRGRGCGDPRGEM